MIKTRIFIISFIFILFAPSTILAEDLNEIAYQNRFLLKAGTILNNEGKGDSLIYPYYDVRKVDGKKQITEINIENFGAYGIVAKLRFRDWSRGREVFSSDIWIPSNGIWNGKIEINDDGTNAKITGSNNVISWSDSGYFYLSTSLSGGALFSTRNLRRNTAESTLYGYVEVIGSEKTSPQSNGEKVARLSNAEQDCPNTLKGNALINRVEEGASMGYQAVAIGNFSRGQGSLFRSNSTTSPRLDASEDTLDQLEFQLSKLEIFGPFSSSPSNQGKTSLIVTYPTKHFHYSNGKRVVKVNNPFEAYLETTGESLKTTISAEDNPPVDSSISLPYSVNIIGLYKDYYGNPKGIDNVSQTTYSNDFGDVTLTAENIAEAVLIEDFEYLQERFMMYRGLPAIGLLLYEYRNADQLQVSINPAEYSAVWEASTSESVFIPTILSGPSSGAVGVSYTYTTGGSKSSLDHPIQYLIDWGDGTNSGWLDSGITTAAKTWTTAGTFTIRSKARCAFHTEIVSKWSTSISMTIESVSAPTVLSGPTTGEPNTTYTYTTGGSFSSAGHPVQYFFDWGDTTDSGWLPVGTTTAAKSWTKGGIYVVKAKARCSTDTSVVSDWTSGLTVTIETVSTPTTPVGPTLGNLGQSYSFSTGGAVSNLSHPVEYQFDWADGTFSSWGPSTQSKSWNAYGEYKIKARARCATHPNVVSDWSSELTFVIESVSTPVQPTGPLNGMKGEALTYTGSGAVSTLNHDLEYQFDWGDGSTSSWTLASYDVNLRIYFASQSKAWNASGVFTIKTRARCYQHPEIISNWSSGLVVTIEFVSAPNTPTGQTSGTVGEGYLYTTGGSSSDRGDSVQYRFDWGDGTTSEWLSVGTSSVGKAWTAPGTYGVRAQARCGVHNTVISGWSQSLVVTINPGPPPPAETVTTPSTPSGSTNGVRGVPYTYTASGASSSLGHALEYKYDWGDGTFSSWGGVSQSKAWTSSGTYTVKVRARCSNHPTVVSDWSTGLAVIVEFVSTPNIPTGPTGGTVGEGYLYTTGGSSSDRGDSVQYRFDWGDGTTSGWLSIGTSSVGKAWVNPGTYTVRAQARCAIHGNVISSWSQGITVTIIAGPPPQTETISTPFIEAYGPSDRGTIYEVSGNRISGRKNIPYEFTIQEGVSNLGHTTEHQFDWGNGTLSAWGGSSNNAWPTSGTYTVKVRARCAQHPTVVSDWSSGLTMVIDYITAPDRPVWESPPVDDIGLKGTPYTFSTGGSSSEIGQEIQYRFNWGDGTNSGWLTTGTTSAVKTWNTQGTYTVRAEARGWWYLGADLGTEHFSYYSPELMVTIRP